jgi:hypothetical protein
MNLYIRCAGFLSLVLLLAVSAAGCEDFGQAPGSPKLSNMRRSRNRRCRKLPLIRIFQATTCPGWSRRFQKAQWSRISKGKPMGWTSRQPIRISQMHASWPSDFLVSRPSILRRRSPLIQLSRHSKTLKARETVTPFRPYVPLRTYLRTEHLSKPSEPRRPGIRPGSSCPEGGGRERRALRQSP